VVVSAMAGITDMLIQGAQRASQRDGEAQALVDRIAERHEQVVKELVAPGAERNQLLQPVGTVMAELRALRIGVQDLAERTPRTLGAIAGVGERLSFGLMAACLQLRAFLLSP